MRRDITIPSGDYTSSPFVEELSFSPGRYSLKRILATISGNSSNVTVGVYHAPSGKASLTDAERAAGEVYLNDAVAAASVPDPELNVAGQPRSVTIRKDESVYVLFSAGNNPTSGTVRLFL